MNAAGPSTPTLPIAWSTLAWRNALRNLRAGEWRLLMVAVILAVAAVSAVGLLADRLRGGLIRDAAQLLGGDVVVAGDQPLPEEWRAWAQQAGARVATTVSFPSMARSQSAGGEFRLVAVKAVSEAYPLRGQLTVSEDGAVRRGPAPGTVWVEPALLDALGLSVGDTLWLGEQGLKVSQALLQEPDRGAGFMSFSPRVMMHPDDLAATGLIQPASRVTYRLLMAHDGGLPALAAVRARLEAAVQAPGVKGVRMDSLESGRPEMRQTLDRAEKFLSLVALLTAVLAAVAVGIAARDFSQRHVDACALLRVLGLSQRTMAWAFFAELALVGGAAAVVGLAAGWGVHLGFHALLQGLIPGGLPPPTVAPIGTALLLGWVLVLGFGLPPVLQLAKVPPLRVLRRDLGTPRLGALATLGLGLAAFALLLMATARDWTLGVWTLLGFALALGAFAALAWGVLVLLRTAQRRVPVLQSLAPLRMATRQLAARPGLAVLQVSALALGLLALVLLVLLRTDLIGSWRAATPPDAPNRFVINIQPDQAAGFQATLQAGGVERGDWFPMIRGRLVTVNGEAAEARAASGSDRARRLVEREFNLSHSAALPSHNQVVQGAWTAEDVDGISVEEGLAQTLGLRLGDRLGFDIAGQVVDARITSLRKVDWGSMRVNFFVLFPRAQWDAVPSTYISAFRAPAAQAGALDKQLVQSYPNITLVDVSASVAQVQRVLDQVIRAVEFLFAFTLAAGLVVMVSTLTVTRESRLHEYAILRALGAQRVLLARTQSVELLGVGALAGLLASAVAVALGMVLAQRVFEFAWTPSPLTIPAGMACGAALAWLGGQWGLRTVLRQPVVQTLRQAAA